MTTQPPLTATMSEPVALRLTSAFDLIHTTFPETPDLILGVLPQRSRAIISGPAKLGKTRYGLGLAIGIATGNNVMGFEINGPRRVLYFQTEVSEANLQRRLKTMLDALTVDEALLQKNLLFCSERLKLTDAENCSVIRETLRRCQPEILVFDPLYKYNNGDESTVAGMTRFFDPLDDWIHDFGLSVILVHHHGKSRGGYPTTAHLNRGSSSIADWPDSLLTLTHEDPATGIVRLTFTLRNAEEPEPMAYYRNSQTLWFEPLADYDFSSTKRRGAPRKVTPEDAVELVQASAESRTYSELTSDLVERFGVSVRTAKNVIAESLGRGLLAKNEASRYVGAEITCV